MKATDRNIRKFDIFSHNIVIIRIFPSSGMNPAGIPTRLQEPYRVLRKADLLFPVPQDKGLSGKHPSVFQKKEALYFPNNSVLMV
ncbi:hypothetical protein [Gluconobacter morbifer]|uniref:Uncharacterized protein n=1 Tax=Gluconobacter morbifer G707 TaxID=1088869 RepID=G6XEY3_9PROT|nr:hypothetical protein [Gluconobacter morbifer]EHH68741.1 hypothetical protein GMO_00480 [Gluconobacter morbifer G707]